MNRLAQRRSVARSDFNRGTPPCSLPLRLPTCMHRLFQVALQCVAVCCKMKQCVAVCCSVLQCVAVCCSVLQNEAVCCSVLQCVAVCCSVLKCAAECCNLFLCEYQRVCTVSFRLC